MPTVLYMLGVDSDKYQNTALGRNLLNTKRSYAVLTDGSIRAKDLSSDEEQMLKNSLDISDKMIRSNYFNN